MTIVPANAVSLAVEDGVAVLTFDLPGESVNKFSPAVIEEFTALLARIDADPAVQAAVLISGKPGTFIAGADIDQFLTFASADDAAQASAFGHAMFDRIESGRVPVVVAVDGEIPEPGRPSVVQTFGNPKLVAPTVARRHDGTATRVVPGAARP